MSDNVVLNPGALGDTVAADDIGGIKFQRVKLSLGADGTGVDAVAGAGVVGTGVQRVTLASDDPAVAILGTSGALVQGMAAENAAVAGKPVLAGGRYDSSPRTLDSGDAGALALNAAGQVQVDIVAGGVTSGTAGTPSADVLSVQKPTSNTWQYAAPAGGLVDTTPVAAKTAAGASVRNYINAAQITNSHATIGTEVTILSASTVIWRGWVGANGGGISVVFDPPLKPTANDAINVAEVTATATAGVLVNLQGFTGA